MYVISVLVNRSATAIYHSVAMITFVVAKIPFKVAVITYTSGQDHF